MKSLPPWQFDETKACGVDYNDVREVAEYDRTHMKFRDYDALTEHVFHCLNLDGESAIIDMGAGTGAFALRAAKRCRSVHAVDISRAMLDYARRRAREEGTSNIVFHHGGLLTYEHAEEPADGIVCALVLHHLPDFWKKTALERFHGMLKPGGGLYLSDIVFPSAESDMGSVIEEMIKKVEAAVDPRLAWEGIVHIKEELSTYDWIMDGILSRSGFEIKTCEKGDMFQMTYICGKR